MKFNRIHLFRGLFLGMLMFSFGVDMALAQKEAEQVEKYRVVYDYTDPQFEQGGPDGGNVNVQPALPPDSMGVRYNMAPSFQHLIDLHRRHNESTLEGKGFRIQIYAGSKMEIANEAKADFIQQFRDSGMEVYKDWNPPHFWVRVGDFLSRNEAMRQLPNVKLYFPDAFVVADKINMPKFKRSSGTTTEHKEPLRDGQN